MKLNTLIEAGDPEKLAGDFQFTEGPIWQADGSLLFSDIPANRIYRWKMCIRDRFDTGKRQISEWAHEVLLFD